MVLQRICGSERCPLTSRALAILHLKSVSCLVYHLLVFSAQFHGDNRGEPRISVAPPTLVVLASEHSGSSSTMSGHFTSPTRTTHIATSKTAHGSDANSQRIQHDKKSRTRSVMDGKDWQAHGRRPSPVLPHVPDEERHNSEAATDYISAAVGSQPRSLQASIVDENNTDSVRPGEKNFGDPHGRAEEDGHEVRHSGGTVPPCGGGMVRLERECVTIPVEDRYDYIVVGCGAVGCPLSKTLADGGNRVLVLERGHKRSSKNTPNAMDIYGAGKAVSDTSMAQLIHTNQGVRTQTAGIMGGGTSINMGIVAMETRPYFENLSKEFGWTFDFKRLEKAFKWVSKAFHVMPQDATYSARLRSSLQRHGHRPLQGLHPNVLNHQNAGAVNHSRFLHEGHVWGGATLFDATKRYFRDAADIFLDSSTAQQRSSQAGELVVREGTYVERVLFESEGRPTPRAACVLHRPTEREDMAPIGLRRKKSWQTRKGDPANSVFKNTLRRIGRIFTSVFRTQSRSQLSCINIGGEIFLSAGAVHTPLLLFRSGIGPKEQLAELDLEPTHVNAHVGRHLTDRILVPILLFANETKSRDNIEPRVCQVLGMRRVGPSCKGVGVNKRTLKCSLIATEELSGPNIVHGLLWASHMLFPPSWRDNPALNAALEFARLCEAKLPYKGTLQYPPACIVLEEYNDCLDRSFSVFYFTTEPKSRGYIRQHKGGIVEFEANYLKDEQDLFDAVRGAQSLIQMVNGGQFDDIAQPLHANSCPVMMLRTLVDLVIRFARAEDLKQYRDQLLLVRLHAADLQPPHSDGLAFGLPKTLLASPGFLSHRSTEALETSVDDGLGSDTTDSMRLGSQRVKDEHNAEPGSTPNAHNYEAALREVFKDKEILEKLLQARAPQSHSPSTSGVGYGVSTPEETKMPFWAHDAYDFKACVDLRACKEDFHTETYTTTCLARDVFSKRFKLPACTARKKGEGANLPESFLHTEEWLLGLVKRGLRRFFAADLPVGSSQTLATYPPILPRADDPEEVAAFALTYMTSIWHIGGTAAMGLVVDDMFHVKGVHGLSIADASLLNQMTRLNPTATLMTLGRNSGRRQELQQRIQKRVNGSFFEASTIIESSFDCSERACLPQHAAIHRTLRKLPECTEFPAEFSDQLVAGCTKMQLLLAV